MKHTLPTTPCKGCGKPIVFAKLESGELIPLDPRPPIYWAYLAQDGPRCRQIKKQVTQYREDDFPDGDAMVNHFATCSHAAEFSKKGKTDGQTKA